MDKGIVIQWSIAPSKCTEVSSNLSYLFEFAWSVSVSSVQAWMGPYVRSVALSNGYDANQVHGV